MFPAIRCLLMTPATRPAPPDEYAIPAGTCPRCGMVGQHPRPLDCIDHLRGMIAVLEFVGARTGRKPKTR
jgi:hypothetical protein